MKNILDAPFVEEMKQTTANMYRLGWDERNGGNISWMLEEDEVAEYLDLNQVIRTIPIGFDASVLAGKIFIVTGSGKYFKNVHIKNLVIPLFLLYILAFGLIFIINQNTNILFNFNAASAKEPDSSIII